MGNKENAPIRFRLDVDLSAVAGDPTEELSRVLRYWAGNMKHYDFEQPATETVYDSEYREVGGWSLA
ncbi:hypothetical protein [Nesterenkonia ebinurensis]|uniref:hypothetical protein n=1 Tax=Nesterenkonia ebinurensis TaxID=2608252 RepID=UPI00123DEA95|nr:hypothetical protein [Nesterenkonia ebinurensis]